VNPVSIVVLSRYPDLFFALQKNIDSVEDWHSRGDVECTLIRDGYQINWSDEAVWDLDWGGYQGKETFSYAKNVNLAWSAMPEHDILLCGDDVRFTTTFIDTMHQLAYSDPKIGVVTPQMYGQSPFVCGFFKREVINKVGPMDERFSGYGYDDRDWCFRMEQLGYHTHPTTEVKCTHTGGTSFYRREREGAYRVQDTCDANRALFNAKWGIECGK
jgi:hypothetical protein